MTEDRFDEVLRETARSYNEPPPTPRDEMWERIAAVRQAERQRKGATVVPMRRFPWWLGMAATLLLGVAIGRSVLQPGGAGGADTSNSAAQPAAAAVSIDPEATPPANGVDALAAERGAGSAAELTKVATSERSPRTSPRSATATRRATEESVGASRSAPATRSDLSGLYRHVAYETLGQAEAVLALYREDGRPESRERVALWARDVLSSTRLLLDSPASEDAALSALLKDLEIVLARLAAFAGDDDQQNDRELIDDAIRQRDVIPRLRTVLPAGAALTGA
jgi:hypothetical protein